MLLLRLVNSDRSEVASLTEFETFKLAIMSADFSIITCRNAEEQIYRFCQRIYVGFASFDMQHVLRKLNRRVEMVMLSFVDAKCKIDRRRLEFLTLDYERS